VWIGVFYYEKFIPWLKQNRKNHLRSIYTEHLAEWPVNSGQ